MHLSASPPGFSSIHPWNLLNEKWNHRVPVRSCPKTTNITPKCGSLTETGLQSADRKGQRGLYNGCISDSDSLSTTHAEGTRNAAQAAFPPFPLFLHTNFWKLPILESYLSRHSRKGRKWNISWGKTLAGALCYLSYAVMTLRQFSYEYRRALYIGQIMFIHWCGDNSHIAKKMR